MIGAELYILDVKVDLYDDVSINLTDNIKNSKDVGKVFAAFTQQFRIPASKTNNKLFQHYYDVKVLNGFDARRKHSAIIKVGGANYQKGYAKLNGVDLENNKAKSYLVQFFGEITALKDRLGEDLISSLDSLDQFDHDFNSSNVIDGFEEGLDITSGVVTKDSDGQICYPFISHTRGFTYSTTDGLYDLTQLSTVTTNDRLDYTDLKPALRVSKILEAIEAKYNFDFTGDFLTNQVFTELWIWCHKNKGGLVTDDVTTNRSEWQGDLFDLTRTAFTKDPSDPIGFDVEVYDQEIASGNDWDKTFNLLGLPYNVDPDNNFQILTYNLGNGQFTKYNCELTITPSGSFTDDYSVFLWDSVHNQYYVQEINTNGTFTDTFTIEGDPVKLRNIEIKVTSDALDEFDIEFVMDGQRDQTNTSIRQRSWTYEKTVTSAELITYARVAYNLPKMKVIDFLTALFKMFNLVAYPTPKNIFSSDYQITIQTFDEFKDSGFSRDITKYIDTSSSNVERVSPFNKLSFKYEDPSTFLAITRNEITSDEFGNAGFTTKDLGGGSDDWLFDGGEYSVMTGLEKMMYERITDIDDDTFSELQWGWFVNDFSENSPEPEVGSPLFFYRINRACTTDTITWKDTTVTNTTYNAPSNVIEDGTQTLNFDAEIDEYDLITNENSLFENFYRRFISGIYNENSRRVKYSAYLPPSFIFNYAINDKLIISDVAFDIDKIDINLLTGKSNLELLRLTPYEQEYEVLPNPCLDLIDFSGLDIVYSFTHRKTSLGTHNKAYEISRNGSAGAADVYDVYRDCSGLISEDSVTVLLSNPAMIISLGDLVSTSAPTDIFYISKEYCEITETILNHVTGNLTSAPILCDNQVFSRFNGFIMPYYQGLTNGGLEKTTALSELDSTNDWEQHSITALEGLTSVGVLSSTSKSSTTANDSRVNFLNDNRVDDLIGFAKNTAATTYTLTTDSHNSVETEKNLGLIKEGSVLKSSVDGTVQTVTATLVGSYTNDHFHKGQQRNGVTAFKGYYPMLTIHDDNLTSGQRTTLNDKQQELIT